MRIILTTSFIWLLFISAQSQERSSYIELRGGLSVPVGKYGSADLNDGCFTLPGFTVGAEGAWYFKPYFGVGGQFGYNLHPVDVSLLGYEKVLDDPFLNDLAIRSDPYQIITSAVGLFSRWNFWKKMSVQGKLLGGIMWAKTPYQLYKPEYYAVGPEYFEITSSKDSNFMGVAGLGLQYDLSPCIALKLDGEYQFSQMVFGFNTATGIRYDYRNIGFIVTSLGLIINLSSL